MDRKLGQTQRTGKSKLSHHTGDLFALGSKPTSTAPKDPDKRGMTLSKSSWDTGASSSKVTSLIGSKREAPTSTAASVPKKPKLSVSTVTGRPLVPTGSVTTPIIEPWESHAVDIDPPDLVPTVLYAVDNEQHDTMINAVCGALRTLKSTRWKFDSVLYYSLMYLCKMRPKIFSNTIITTALCSLLRRDSNVNIKTRTNIFVPILAANLLARAYQDKREWPISFIKIFVEDALNERVWVDNDDCKLFTTNIQTAFNTIVPAQHLLQTEQSSIEIKPSIHSEISSPLLGSDEESMENSPKPLKQNQDHLNLDDRISQRYTNTESIESYLIEVLKESISKRSTPTDLVTRNTLKLMAVTCGLLEVRLLAVSRLEVWLHNAKLMKPAQELLAYLCYNLNSKTPKDLEVITQYVKMRLKTKPLCNVYLSCLKAIVKDDSEILNVLMKHTIYNELSNARNPNNISMVVLMFQEQTEKAPIVLADIYKEYLLNREDCLRQLRLFLRELVRALRYDVNLYSFCFTLVSKDRNFNSLVENLEFKDRILSSISDLLCLCMLLGISPQVKETAASCTRGDKKDLNILQSYQLQVSRIQFEAIRWMEKTVPWLYKPTNADYLSHIRKILFLENNYEPYVKVDTWPTESERGFFFKLVGEVRVHQNTLIRLCRIGQQKSCPMAARDSLELCEQLVKRCGDMSQDYLPLLHFDKIEIIDLLFRLTQYHYPDNITLPYGYSPPTLAIAIPYWKAWGIVLILAAHNPVSIGLICWEQYPMLRILMEMCITNQFVYPPPTSLNSQSALELVQNENDMERMEKLEIIELETHLAAATTQMKITEETSLLVNQLIRYDPTGPSRKPQPAMLESLANLNKSHNLGHLFCRSREPDFLMDIIQRQGTSQSMPWLAELVENSESVSLLPVQCLCEFLLSSEGPNQEKHLQLLQHLQNLVTNQDSSPQTACEVLDYFLRRLASPLKLSRMQAIKGLQLLLGCVIIEETASTSSSAWLIHQMPLLPHFEHIRMQVISALRAACQIDMIPENIVYYLHFLAMHTSNNTEEDLTELVMDLAQLVVERILIMNSIMSSDLYKEALSSLLSIYCSYLTIVKVIRNDQYYTMADAADMCLIKWPTGEECFICLNVIHAMILLLTYDPVENKYTRLLLDTWFPISHDMPKGFLYEANNELRETNLYPDWLLLRMVHSPVQRLVDAALHSLKPSQLLVFIQSFGYPLESISKCLKALDNWVMMDANSVNQVMENDRPYIAMCVAVQHMRGVTDGKIFLRTCDVYEVKYAKLMKGKLQDVDIKSYVVSTPIYKKSRSPPKTLRNVLNEMLFEQDFLYNNIHNMDYNSAILRTIAIEQKSKHVVPGTVLFQVLKYFHNLDQNRLLSLFIVKSPLLLSLLHLLLSHSSDSVKELLFAIFHKAIIKTNVLFETVPTTEILYRLLQNTILKNEATLIKTSAHSSILKNLKSIPIEQLERGVRNMIMNKRNVGSYDNVELINSLCSWLLENDGGADEMCLKNDSVSYFEMQISKSQRNGMLIDWFASIEPNMVSSRTKLQMDLLFSRRADSKGFRPYLLTLLTHQTSWSTLSYCVEFLLTDIRLDYDPSAVLDFLMTLILNPKLWQGRDKFIPKHYVAEDVLELSVQKILTVLDYVLLEALKCYKEHNRDKVIRRIDRRLTLLTHCTRNDHNIIKIMVQYLYMQLMNTKLGVARRRVVAQFLIQFYMLTPIIILYQPGLSIVVNNTDVKQSVTNCQVDTMCQSIFTALASTPALKDWHRKSQDLELSARKISAVHPNLVLRHLPMIAGSLQGRTHLEFSQFRSRYHLALFSHIIGVLELLTPMLFREEHQTEFESIISLYINLFHRHMKHIKELTNLLNRFVNLLQNYISYNPKRALGHLRTHASALQDLYATMPHMQNLKNISTGVSLLHQDSEQNQHMRCGNHDKIKSICLEMGMVAMDLHPSQTEPFPQHWSSLVNSLMKLHGDEVMSSLQDLDHITNKKPAFLADVLELLCDLINSPAANIRNLAHILLLRHLKFAPQTFSCTDICFTSFMKSLLSQDPDVRLATLERVQDYIICLQEHSLLILQTLFRLGAKSKVNTMPFISKCLAALKLQDGN